MIVTRSLSEGKTGIVLFSLYSQLRPRFRCPMLRNRRRKGNGDMSSNSDNGDGPGLASGIGFVAALICFPLGLEAGGWPGGLIASAMAFGGVHLVFAAVALALRIIVALVILGMTVISIQGRIAWLANLFGG